MRHVKLNLHPGSREIRQVIAVIRHCIKDGAIILTVFTFWNKNHRMGGVPKSVPECQDSEGILQ